MTSSLSQQNEEFVKQQRKRNQELLLFKLITKFNE